MKVSFKSCLCSLLAGVALNLSPSLWSATLTWNVDADGTWSVGSNWTPASAPGKNDDVVLGSVITADRTLTIGTDEVNFMTFNDNNQYTLSSGELTLSKTGLNLIQSGTGTVVIDSALKLKGNSTFGGSGTGTITINGAIGQQGAGKTLTKDGSYTLVLNANNTYSGATTINAGTLQATATGSLGATASVTVNTGGTLLFTGASSDRVNNTAGITLAGGTLTAQDVTETMGTLTLSANSTINLGTDGNNDDLTFAGGTLTAGILTINNWSGSSSGGTDDRIFFTTDPGAAFLANIQFSGPEFTAGAIRLGSGEVVPIPEPGTILSALFLTSLLAKSCRARRKES